jgi:succinate dehydrogenase (ubiquinone) membrane anchor subunit
MNSLTRRGASAALRRVPAAGRKQLSFMAADEGAISTKVYHSVNMGILVLTPMAFALAPSKWVLPVDLALGLALPLHMHIGMNYVITDYSKKFLGLSRGTCQVAMVGVTGMTVLGLTNLNLRGPGITETIKSLWYHPSNRP